MAIQAPEKHDKPTVVIMISANTSTECSNKGTFIWCTFNICSRFLAPLPRKHQKKMQTFNSVVRKYRSGYIMFTCYFHIDNQVDTMRMVEAMEKTDTKAAISRKSSPIFYEFHHY